MIGKQSAICMALMLLAIFALWWHMDNSETQYPYINDDGMLVGDRRASFLDYNVSEYRFAARFFDIAASGKFPDFFAFLEELFRHPKPRDHAQLQEFDQDQSVHEREERNRSSDCRLPGYLRFWPVSNHSIGFSFNWRPSVRDLLTWSSTCAQKDNMFLEEWSPKDGTSSHWISRNSWSWENAPTSRWRRAAQRSPSTELVASTSGRSTVSWSSKALFPTKAPTPSETVRKYSTNTHPSFSYFSSDRLVLRLPLHLWEQQETRCDHHQDLPKSCFDWEVSVSQFHSHQDSLPLKITYLFSGLTTLVPFSCSLCYFARVFVFFRVPTVCLDDS